MERNCTNFYVTGGRWVGRNECDQMGKLLVQYLANFNNVNLHNSIKNCPNGLKILPNTKLKLEKLPKTLRIFAKVTKFQHNWSHWTQHTHTYTHTPHFPKSIYIPMCLFFSFFILLWPVSIFLPQSLSLFRPESVL